MSETVEKDVDSGQTGPEMQGGYEIKQSPDGRTYDVFYNGTLRRIGCISREEAARWIEKICAN